MNNSLIHMQLLLDGGHTQDITLTADSPELGRMFRILAARSNGSGPPQEQLIQLPLDGGRESFSIHSSKLVAVVTRPPIVIEYEQLPDPTPETQVPAPAPKPVAVSETGQVHRPPHMVIDNFLGCYEHQDMLAHALQQKDQFEAGTVVNGQQNERQNMAILEFAQHPHSKLLCNRLLTWFPQIVHTLGIDLFPIKEVESQLTASNDGQYYRAHLDADEGAAMERVLTCVYYFSKQPAQFSGGALRIYDKRITGGQVSQADTFQQVEPISNRMVVFPSNSYHELLPIRCPSRQFEDSRFAVTNWIWHSENSDPDATHGWGHMHCMQVPENWRAKNGSAS